METAKSTTIKIRIYFSDTDAVGIVYHANYLDFAERARVELTRECGFDIKKLADEKMFLVVRTANLEYLSPARLDDLITVKAFVSHVGKTSMEVTHEMFDETTNRKICTVKCVLVFIDMKGAVPAPTAVPSEVIKCFFN